MLSLCFLLVLTLALPLLLLFKKYRSTTTLYPPGPRGLPIIGNLHQLDSSILYLQLWKLSKTYGPLFSIQLGLKSAIVVSSHKIAREVLKTNDLVFSSRPNLLGQQKLSYSGSDIVFAPYSDNWREIRKICMIHVFSLKRVQSFSLIRKFEVHQMIKKISRHAASSVVTNLSELLITLSRTIVCRIAFGRRYVDEGNESSRFHEMMKEMEVMFTRFFVSDYIPFMGFIDKLTRLDARLERNFKEFDKFSQEVIDQHLDPSRKQTNEEDVVDVLIKLKHQHFTPIDLSFDHIKGVVMDMLVGGTDTTAATLIWAMTALIKNRRVMKKVQDEIRSLGGNKDFLEENDVQKFSYMKAVIKETLRLYPPAPLLVPRQSTKHCIIDGYHIPTNTIVYVNAWALQRDPNIWNDPDAFYPERFLDSSINFLGQDLELIPFGAGRRICPGSSMAVATLELTLANLLYSFDWNLPSGLTKEDIDSEVLPGLTQHKKNALCLCAKIHV